MPSGGSNTVTENADPWAPLQPYLQEQAATASAVGSQALPFYPQNTFAPTNDLQVGGQYAALDYAQNRFQPGTSYLQGQAQRMIESPDRIMENPAMQAQMAQNQREVTQSLQRDWLPSVRANSQAAGHYGSSKHALAEGQAIGDAGTALANANTQTMNNAYNQAIGSQNVGMASMPGALSMGFLGPQTAMEIGGQQQAQNQRYIDEMVQRYYYPETKTMDMLNFQTGVYNGIPGGQSTSTSPGSSGLANALGMGMTGYGMLSNAGLLGGAAAAGTTMASSLGPLIASGAGASAIPAATYAMAMGIPGSDRRLKKNIKPDYHDGKYQWYRFEYIDPAEGEGEQVGVMADEVMKITPEAVHVRPDGMMAVNYGAL